MRSLLLSALLGVGLTFSENVENTEELFHLGHILHEAGKVAEVASVASSIAFDVMTSEEELFHLGHILHEAGKVAEVASVASSIAFAAQPNPAQVIGTILDDADKVAEAIEPVVEIIGDIAGDSFRAKPAPSGDELFHLGHVLHEAGKVAEVASVASSIAFAAQPNPAQVIGTILDDADKVAEAIEPVVEIIGDIAGDSFRAKPAPAPEDELFHLGHILHEAGKVAEVASVASSIAFAKQPSPAQVIGTILDDADKVAKAIEPVVEIIGDVAGDSFIAKPAPVPEDELFHLGHILHEAGKVAEVASVASSIAFDAQPKKFLSF